MPSLTRTQVRDFGLQAQEHLMDETRRDFLKAAMTAAGAAANSEFGHAPTAAQDHQHQAVPSDLTLRVKSLESLLTKRA